MCTGCDYTGIHTECAFCTSNTYCIPHIYSTCTHIQYSDYTLVHTQCAHYVQHTTNWEHDVSAYKVCVSCLRLMTSIDEMSCSHFIIYYVPCSRVHSLPCTYTHVTMTCTPVARDHTPICRRLTLSGNCWKNLCCMSKYCLKS